MCGDRRLRRRLEQALEGWELGLLAVTMAVVAAWLALPRPVSPSLVPVPQLDFREIARERERDRELADEARRSQLSFEVRAVGELVRRYGAATAAHQEALALDVQADLQRLVRRVREREGAASLLKLRALQTGLFLGVVGQGRAPASTSRELAELAGDFTEQSRALHWQNETGQCSLSDDELWALYRVRWTRLAGLLKDVAFRPTLDEFRLYYRVSIVHAGGDDPRRLEAVTALGRMDPDYPTAFARGVLLYRMGRIRAASDAFSAHLAAHPNGPWALRARNHALAALAEAGSRE
jgi:hypothetical protein